MRTDFSTAMQRVLHVLENGDPYTLNKLSLETKLNFRTVKKAIDFFEQNQRALLDKTLEIYSTDNLTFIRLKEKSGLALYPDHIQRLIIRTSYYPTTTRDEEILVYLLLNGAINDETAINLEEDAILKGLIEAEHIAKTADGRYYLSEDGVITAKGAVRLYPELKDTKLQKRRADLAQKISLDVQGLFVPVAPLLPVIESKLHGGK